MNCEWQTLTEGSVCSHPGCRNKLRRDYERAPVCECKGRQVGLGDWAESQLKKLGITKDLFGQITGAFGLPCGCDARQEWLNSVSDWWRARNAP